jgi:hypothetical protein
MQAIATAAAEFFAARGRLPTVQELRAGGPGVEPRRALAEQDPWGGYYRLRFQDAQVQAISSGPDRELGTPDDLVVADRKGG